MRSWTLLALGVLSCGGPPAAQQGTGFSAQESQVVTGASGLLEVLVYERAGSPVSRGVNSVRYGVRRAGGAALDDAALSLEVTPWMPVMGHGSAVVPSVQAVEGGFVITDLYLAMPGRWELRSDFSGELVDHASVVFDIQ
jgi:hypothetical protein